MAIGMDSLGNQPLPAIRKRSSNNPLAPASTAGSSGASGPEASASDGLLFSACSLNPGASHEPAPFALPPHVPPDGPERASAVFAGAAALDTACLLREKLTRISERSSRDTLVCTGRLLTTASCWTSFIFPSPPPLPGL